MIELTKFDCMATFTYQFGSCDKILQLTTLDILVSEHFFKIHFLKRFGVANLAGITRIAIAFIKTNSEKPIKFKRITNYALFVFFSQDTVMRIANIW